MTKNQIYSEYNSLTSMVVNLLNDYKTLTGKDFPGKIRTTDLAPYEIMNYKYDLENMLIRRKSSIYSIREGIENFKSAQSLYETEEGRVFIDNLKVKKNTLNGDLQGLNTRSILEFNDLLESIGMSDWKLSSGDLPNFDYNTMSISHKSCKDAHLSIYIKMKSGKFEMGISSSVRGDGTISKMGMEYYQFKAYVNMVDHRDEIQAWLDNNYTIMAKCAYDIKDEIARCESDLEDPYAAFNRVK